MHRCKEINTQQVEEKSYKKKESNSNPSIMNNKNHIVDYFTLGPKREADKRVCAKITEIEYNEFKDDFFFFMNRLL